MVKLFVGVKIATVLVLLVLGAVYGKQSQDAEQAHSYADHVLYPRLVAAMDDYALQHPNAVGHEKLLNAGDAKRVQTVREAFKAWSDKLKEAGY